MTKDSSPEDSLREKVADAGSLTVHGQAMNAIMQVVKAHSLQERIDELESIVLPDKRLDKYGYSDDENGVGYNSALQTVEIKIDDRIKDLESEKGKL